MKPSDDPALIFSFCLPRSLAADFAELVRLCKCDGKELNRSKLIRYALTKTYGPNLDQVPPLDDIIRS